MPTDVTQPSPRPYCRARYWPSKVGRVAKEPMVTRNFRVPRKVWDDALATADAAGVSLSDALREFVEWYARYPRARQPWRPDAAVRAGERADS